MISAKVVADSVNAYGNRLTSMQVTGHRFILAELNTHRVFSRNYRSSRAVPVAKLLHEVRTAPAMPVYWGANQAGMQAAEELTGNHLLAAKEAWLEAAVEAADSAEGLAAIGLHKQIANRILEPFLYVHGVISSTEWDNFFGLRLDKAAQPEMRALTEAMWVAYNESTPDPLLRDQWHLPYIGAWDRDTFEEIYARHNDPMTAQQSVLALAKKISVARCARVSYKSFETEKPSTVEEDLKLYDRLVGSQPIHASPAEHQATPDLFIENEGWLCDGLHGNFTGFIQYRKTLQGEGKAPLPEGYKYATR